MKNVKRFLMAGAIACLPLLGLSGCGGGADDATKVTLRPNKVEPKGGAAGGSNDGGSSTGGSETGGAAAKEGYGTIKGRLIIAEADKGSLPPADLKIAGVGEAKVDPNFCAKESPIPNETLIVNRDNMGLKNAFFYLEKKPRRGKDQIASQSTWPTADESSEKLVLDQKNCTYVPHAMIVLAGQNFVAQSQDSVTHSYKGNPPSSGSFNITIPPAPPGGGEAPAVELNPFKKPERNPVPISCATHNWMSGYQLPLDHPYAAVTNDNGEFTISDLPSGTHTFTIWHEKKGKVRELDVEVKADETTDLKDITLRLSQLN